MIPGITIKKALVLLVLFLLGAGIFIALMAKFGFAETIQTLLLFGVGPFSLFLLISLTNFGLYTYRWQKIVNHGVPKEKRMGFMRLYLHRMSGYATSYLLPMQPVGGEPIRVALLVEDGVSFNKATSSVVIDIAFELTSYILFVVAGMILALVGGVGLGQTGVLIGITVGLATVILGLFYWATITGRGFFRSIFRFFGLHRSQSKRLKEIEVWLTETEGHMTEFLGKQPAMLVWLLALSLIMVSFKVFEQWFIAYFLGTTLTFSQAFLTATIPGAALLLPVPAGLGFFEAGQTGMFALLGVTSINAVALVLIIRLRDAIFIAIGLAHASSRVLAYLRQRLKVSKPSPV